MTSLRELRKVHEHLSNISSIVDERIESMIIFRAPIMYQIQSACHTLQGQLKELSPMTRVYADHYQSGGGPKPAQGHSPQNISLAYWRNQLRNCLIGLWEQVERTAVHGLTSPVINLEETYSKLYELSETMAEFMPLITW